METKESRYAEFAIGLKVKAKIFQSIRLSAIFVLLQCVTITINAQDSCYHCNRDSIIRQLPLVKTDAEKIKSLTIIIDFSPTSDSANYYIGQLIQLNKNHHLVDEAAYKKIAEANNFYLKKNTGAL